MYPDNSTLPLTDDTRAERMTVLPRVDMSGGRPRLLTTSARRYHVVRPLGAGGAGEVFLAEDQDIGRKVAIKKILAKAHSEAMLLRFVREVQTVGRLEHANIVPIHDVGQDERGDYYFVMKYVDGLTLEDILHKLRDGDEDAHRRFGIEQRVQIGRALLEAVAFAHSRGVIHRDLKPANIMVGPYGEVLVLDWGIAKTDLSIEPAIDVEPELEVGVHTKDGALIGTPRYMSPEQAQRQRVDHRSDVYSLCVLLHELLTLRHYLEGVRDEDGLPALLQAVAERPVQLASLVRHPKQEPVPMDLSWILHKGLQKKPEDRYQTLDELLERFRERAEGHVHVECPVTLTKRVTSELERAMDRYIVPHMGWMLTAGTMGMALGVMVMMVLMMVMFGGGLAALVVIWGALA